MSTSGFAGSVDIWDEPDNLERLPQIDADRVIDAPEARGVRQNIRKEIDTAGTHARSRAIIFP